VYCIVVTSKMSDGKWETVGKSKTKAKAGKGSSSKGQQLDDFGKIAYQSEAITYYVFLLFLLPFTRSIILITLAFSFLP